MITVTVQGYGSFVIDSERVQELLSWLARNQAAKVTETGNSNFPGKTLLNG